MTAGPFTVYDLDANYPALSALAQYSVENSAYAGGADPTGQIDSTAAIQAALNTGAAYLQPGGTYTVTELTLPAGAILTGPPQSVNTSPGGSLAASAKLVLAAGANTHMLTIAGNNCYVGNVELDGNRAEQTSGYGNGILYDGQYFGIFERVFAHDQYYRGFSGVSGSGAQLLSCSFTGCNSDGIYLDTASNDCHVRDCLVASNGGDGISVNGYVTHITDNDVWGNSGNGVKVGAGRSATIRGNGIDHNQQHGLVIAGSSVQADGNTFHSNGLAQNAAYHSVIVANDGAGLDSITVADNTFWLDGGVTVKVGYHIYHDGTVVTKTHGNQFQPGSYATGTINVASQAKDPHETG